MTTLQQINYRIFLYDIATRLGIDINQPEWFSQTHQNQIQTVFKQIDKLKDTDEQIRVEDEVITTIKK